MENETLKFSKNGCLKLYINARNKCCETPYFGFLKDAILSISGNRSVTQPLVTFFQINVCYYSKHLETV